MLKVNDTVETLDRDHGKVVRVNATHPDLGAGLVVVRSPYAGERYCRPETLRLVFRAN
jgi:hypothetical protein